MATRRKRRDQWKQTSAGGWTCSLGHRGCRVRLYQLESGGYFYREVRLADGRKDRQTLRTRDRAEAERLGKQLVARLLSGAAKPVRVDVRLGALVEAYLAESPMHLDNAPSTQRDTRLRAAILVGGFGADRLVRTLSENDVRQYEARRRKGGIEYGDGEVSGEVRQRSVQADVKLLKQMLSWACTRTMPDGNRWLDSNPLQYVRVKGENDVQRPVASFDRFTATVAAMQRLQARYAAEAADVERSASERGRAARRHRSWVRAEFGLRLLEATGRRRGAVMGLRWADIDANALRVTWRPEHDKKRKTWVVPYPAAFFAMVAEFRARLDPADPNECVFAREDDPKAPAPRELLSQWIRKAEKEAGLTKLAGGTSHPYRRKWRSERSHLPDKAVAVAGGWSDVGTMFRCYDQPDDADVLAVTSESRKRIDFAVIRDA